MAAGAKKLWEWFKGFAIVAGAIAAVLACYQGFFVIPRDSKERRQVVVNFAEEGVREIIQEEMSKILVSDKFREYLRSECACDDTRDCYPNEDKESEPYKFEEEKRYHYRNRSPPVTAP